VTARKISTNTLSSDISSSGSLTYSGDPTVRKDIGGSGSVAKK
jgi:hypothetical protein